MVRPILVAASMNAARDRVMTLAALPAPSPVFSSAAAVLSAVDAIRSSAL